MVFGVTYEWIRTKYHDRFSGSTLGVNVLAGAFATVVSGPLNYARNMQYAAPMSSSSPSTLAAVDKLFRTAWKQPTWPAAAGYLQHRLRIGWGSARVAVGMAVGQALFDWTRSFSRVEKK